MGNTTKFTFGLDGNWFLISRWQTLCAMKKRTFMPTTFEADRRDLIEILSKTLVAELRRLDNVIDDIVIVTDKNAWRKQHEYLSRKDDEGNVIDGGKLYKAHRTDDEEVDMKKLFQVFYEWLDIMKTKFGISILTSDGAEGDDLIYLLSKELNSNGKNFLYLSTDKDLIQIANYDKSNDSVSVMYRKRVSGYKATRKSENVLTTTKEAHEYLVKKSKLSNSVDVFGDSSSYMKGGNNPCKSLLEFAEDVEDEMIGSFLTHKILFGDKGDGVAPIIKNGRFNVKETHIEKALNDGSMTLESLNKDVVRSDDFINYMISRCYVHLHRGRGKNAHLKPDKALSQDDKDWFISRWHENRKLMMLDEREYPQYVLENYEVELAKLNILNGLKLSENTIGIPTNVDLILEEFEMISSDSVFGMYSDVVLPNVAKSNTGPTLISDDVIPTITSTGGEGFDIDALINKALE